MDEQLNHTQGDGEASTPLTAVEESQSLSHAGEEEVEEEEEREELNEDDELIAKAQKLMEKITSSPENPNPTVLHALASLFETLESRYMEENGSSSSNGRASHSIGKLGNVVRDNDEFFELISSKFLVETRYSMSIQAAAARLLLGCSLTWMYPHIFEEDVLDNIKKWVMEDVARLSAEDRNWKLNLGEHEVSDSEMLRTYSTGLLAVCLAGGGPLLEDVLTSRLSAKLMRYLRIRVLGDTSQKDVIHLVEAKIPSSTGGMKSREESRVRARQVHETSHFDDSRVSDERSLDEQSFGRPLHVEERWIEGGEGPVELADGVDFYGVDADEENRWKTRDLRDETKCGDLDDNARDDTARRRLNRGRTRGKGKGNEGSVDIDQILTSPSSGNQCRNARERSLLRNPDVKKFHDTSKNSSRFNTDSMAFEREETGFEREETDDCFLECKIGTSDISDLVKKAVKAAEAEARAASAPLEAIKAVGDAAAEVVKTAALEEFKTSNNEQAAVLAASRAASTVIDAANAVEVCRVLNSENDGLSNMVDIFEKELNEIVEDFIIPNTESLAQLREKYCIQCLEILGEYVEVLGPVLREKGVEVCLTLLQRSSKHNNTLKGGMFLPDVMKLICALAAHRKFAALFVDRGGIQKLLAVPRVAHSWFGLSSCLFTIGSLQGIMERVCALPSDIVNQVVELAIQLLECPQDQARKNVALFFAAAFVFRAVIDAFDAQGGLQKVLGLLNEAASVRTGVNSGTLNFPSTGSRNERSTSEVLTSSEKQIAYHTCVALRQYFRAHLLLLVESIRPNKNSRSAARNIPNVRAVYKPLDISNEALDSVFLLLQKDRKLGASFVRTRWPAVEHFLSANGHIIMLELCQAPPVERYLHDLLQYALGVLHIVTLVPNSRRMIVNATLSNNRVGIAVILDAASVASNFVDPEIIQPALNVLINLVCPPPSISNKPSLLPQGQQSVSAFTSGHTLDTRDRNADRNTSDRAVYVSSQGDQRERNGESNYVERSSTCSLATSNNTQTPVSTAASGLVGDRRITLGAGAGCAGLAAQLELAYRQAREAVRANNGIKVLLHLLQPRIYSPPAALDCLRALACRVLLGLARDDTIAHILTRLQVGKKLSELIRDSGSQMLGTEQGRWQAELSQVAIELIAIVTNSGRASALAASDAATPTLRRIERAAIAAATPITYHPRELLLLIHEHLQASGMATTAAALLKEAQLTPLPSLAAPLSIGYQSSVQEVLSVLPQWPSGRSQGGLLAGKAKPTARPDESILKCDSTHSISKKKPLVFSPSFGLHHRSQPKSIVSHSPSTRKIPTIKQPCATAGALQTLSELSQKPNADAEAHCKTPVVLPMKRKLSELKDNVSLSSSSKRLNTFEQGFSSPICLTPSSLRKSGLAADVEFSAPNAYPRDHHGRPTPDCLADNLDDVQNSNFHIGGQVTPAAHSGAANDLQPSTIERLTLDSLVVQYLKHQHRQCPAPITTLPPLSLLNPHLCPEPKRSLDAPLNITARLGSREFRNVGGVHGSRRDRQFVYSRFRPWRTCRDDVGALLTCITFLADSSHVVVGSHSGEIKVFESNSNSVIESCTNHQSPLTLVQSYRTGETQLLLSSSSQDVRMWDASSVSGGPLHSFEGCKAARFSHSGNTFAAMSTEISQREILLYDIQTSHLELKLSDTSLNSTGRGHIYSLIHFSPSDTMLLWNGVLWDRRISGPVHRFDQFTDYGGGGFHPAGNEVIINSEVWDLRKFRLLRSVPSLDQTSLTFNARGDVIYAILRRNLEDVMSAVHTRRVKHPLYAAFRTIDAVNYSDIATIPLDRCVLDFTTEQTDSFVGLITLDDQQEMFSSARVYEIGRRKPTEDDSDPDDAESEDEEEDEEEDEDEDLEVILGHGIDGDDHSDPDDLSDDGESLSELDDDEEDDDDDDDDDDGEFIMNGVEFDGGVGVVENEWEDGHGGGSLSSEEEEEEGDYFNGNFFGY